MSGLIWVQSVCKCYQQTTLEGKELNILSHHAKRYLNMMAKTSSQYAGIQKKKTDTFFLNHKVKIFVYFFSKTFVVLTVKVSMSCFQ